MPIAHLQEEAVRLVLITAQNIILLEEVVLAQVRQHLPIPVDNIIPTEHVLAQIRKEEQHIVRVHHQRILQPDRLQL